MRYWRIDMVRCCEKLMMAKNCLCCFILALAALFVTPEIAYSEDAVECDQEQRKLTIDFNELNLQDYLQANNVLKESTICAEFIEQQKNSRNTRGGSAEIVDGTDDPTEIIKQRLGSLNSEGGFATIVDGSPALGSFFNDVVRIKFTNQFGKKDLCTGVAISPDAVLTAAHCGCGFGYTVELKTSNAKTSEFILVQNLSKPHLFPGFECGKALHTQAGKDLALFRFQMPAIQSDLESANSISPAHVTDVIWTPQIKSSMEILSDKRINTLVIAGFGFDENNQLPDSVLIGSVFVVSRYCRLGYAFRSVCAMFREFVLMSAPVTGTGKSTDTCGGDSGGPVYLVEGKIIVNSESSFEQIPSKSLIGITSRGLAGVKHQFNGKCGGGGLYTAVGTKPVLDWLETMNVGFQFSFEPAQFP